MKKILLSFVLIACTLFVSCEKEDSPEKEASLDGTTWKMDALGVGSIPSVALKFEKTAVTVFEASWDDPYDRPYTYVHPTVKISVSGGFDEVEGIVNGKELTVDMGKMIIAGVSGKLIFIKQ